ncbi:uncharacterized protein M421DRAFT_269821 [Didymella exigua CBS 183.55]|uniref:Uncharacterized protein n=1 Tax=Didymella exigua CBS 183.55 TaxID=1150837 RepID=A0A6A5RH63_9PLEO|nr:uncharacterized protein M421DRAFT_269821 [Didymella exigua CBS 183.55]KAF1924947.1 hypothetical protein M421DRAFT_269821 [Didymella exigua CBS 183.55]
MTDEAVYYLAQILASTCALSSRAHGLPECSIRVDTRHLFPNDRSATPTPVLFQTTLRLPRATAIIECIISLHTAEVGM